MGEEHAADLGEAYRAADRAFEAWGETTPRRAIAAREAHSVEVVLGWLRP